MRIDPHPDWLSKSSFARRLGVSPGRVSQLVERGLPVEYDDRIDPARGLAWCAENVRQQGRIAPMLQGRRGPDAAGEDDAVDTAVRCFVEAGA